MPSPEYRILPYRREWMHPAADVLRFLFGADRDENRRYFQWKYHDNPYAEEPLGVVALRGAEVVGFRGYFSSGWTAGAGGGDAGVLVPGDTCVHPAHRRKGLSVAMGRKAMEWLQAKHRLLLNLSAGGNSVPGYLRMGFRPLMPKRYLSRYCLPGLARFLLHRHRPQGFPGPRVRPGVYGEVEVSLGPKPEEMAALAGPLPSAQAAPCFSLRRDAAHFRWRYANGRNRYVFYYAARGRETRAYAALRVHKNNRRAYIVDYGARTEAALEPILAHLARQRTFDIVSIWDLGLERGLCDLLTAFAFRRRGPLRLMEKKVAGDWPVLVRPVRRDFTSADWVVNGIDARHGASWRLREICSDGA